MDSRSDDERLLAILADQGSLTPSQRARVERLMAAGKSLVEAIQATPVLDPLDLVRAHDALRRASSGVIEKVPVSQLYADALNAIGPNESHDEDGVHVYELEGWEGTAAAANAVVAESPELATALAAAVPPSADGITQDSQPSIKSWLAASPPAGHGIAYDLAQDEGIGLVRRVNRLISMVLDRNRAAFQIAWDDRRGGVAYYDTGGSRVEETAEEADLADKMASHLKVLARISPWRADEQEGWFRVTRQGRRHAVLVRSVQTIDGTRRVTAFLRPEEDGRQTHATPQ